MVSLAFSFFSTNPPENLIALLRKQNLQKKLYWILSSSQEEESTKDPFAGF